MPFPEVDFKWVTTSSGALTAFEGLGLRAARTITVVAQAGGSASTAEIGIESGLPSDASTYTIKFDRMGSTGYSLSSGIAATIQLDGPLAAIRPYVISKTASTTEVTILIVAN